MFTYFYDFYRSLLKPLGLSLELYTVKPVFHKKPHSRWVNFAQREQICTNNMNCKWPMQIKPLHTQRKLHSTGLHWGSRWVFRGWRWVFRGWHWVFRGLHWVFKGLLWVRKAFHIPTCWYRQREPLHWGPYPT